MSEITRQPWREIWEMGVVEFLNIICYGIDKAEHEKEIIERWKKTH